MTAPCTTTTTPYTTTTTTTWTPPPGGDGCLRVYFTCQCPGGFGTDVWALVASDCVGNSSCSGASACDPLSFYAEYIDGCLGGVPLMTPVPPCPPRCCEVTTTTSTTTPPVTTTSPPITTPPPSRICEVTWAAHCTGSMWSVNDVPASSVCTDVCAPTGWVVNGNACNYLMTECLPSNCPTLGAECTYGGKPVFNPAIPPCCGTTTAPPTTPPPTPTTFIEHWRNIWPGPGPNPSTCCNTSYPAALVLVSDTPTQTAWTAQFNGTDVCGNTVTLNYTLTLDKTTGISTAERAAVGPSSKVGVIGLYPEIGPQVGPCGQVFVQYEVV